MKVRVSTTARADAETRRATRWWRDNRKAAPYLFDDELAKAIALLTEQPDAGLEISEPGLESMRVLVLQRTRYRVYYEHDVSTATVIIRAIWSAVRGRAPRLGHRRG